MRRGLPRLRAVRPSTVGVVLCSALMVGMPAAAAVTDPASARHAPGTTSQPTLGRLADTLPSETVHTASTIAAGAPTGSAPTGGIDASALAFIFTTAKPGSAAATAIAFALAQRGLPYVWGGDGPQNGDVGFDCSGLTKAAYAAAGIDLPRTAHTQFYAGPHVPDGSPLEPGDLVFYGVPERVHHVGLYIGGGRMVNAPDFGKPVQIAYVRYAGDDYIGATRPAAGHGAAGLLDTAQLPVKVPPTPSRDVPHGPTTFPAPPAPDPTPGAVLGEATPQQLKQSPTLPDTPASTAAPQPSAAATPPASSAMVPLTPTATSAAPTTAAPTTAGPTTAGPTTAGPVVTGGTPSTAPARTGPPGSAATTTPPTAPTTPVTTTTPPPPSITATPPSTTPVTTAPAPPAPAAAVAPTGLTLPGGSLTLTAAAAVADGLPPAPASAAAATRSWRAGAGGVGTAAVRVADDYDAAGLTVGAAVVATGPGDTRRALTVTSRRILTPAQARAVVTALGPSFRVVILQVERATGRVLVIGAA